jgi:hypothetical protein
MAYTYRDSLDDYNARLRNSEPSYKSPAPEGTQRRHGRCLHRHHSRSGHDGLRSEQEFHQHG